MRRIAYIITVVVFLQIAPSISCWEEGTGLETGGDMRVHVLVEDLPEDARQIGLTKQLIQSKVELQLRRNGITPSSKETLEALGYFLYIKVNVVDSCFNIDVEFARITSYIVGYKTYRKIATTWKTGSTGVYGNAKYIIGWLLDNIDIFCNEFLSVNEK